TVFSNNTLGLFNVLKIATDLKIPRLVSASSATIWGLGATTNFIPQRLPLTESSPNSPQNAYALSKMVGEVMVNEVCKTTSLFAYSLRLTLVLSETNWMLEGLPRMQNPERGKEILFAYVWLDDVVEAINRCLRCPGSAGSHHILAINGPDILADESIETLYQRFYQGVPWTGGTSFITTQRAYDMIGFVPQYSWHRMAPSGDARHA
ncbi:MAG: NAD-dependent epimerase/dehydratase family protein, partial [Firmicutes bacterium]|nr:NAD-dependent epimerase/dehydratase family protein [Bacillota bacterium]